MFLYGKDKNTLYAMLKPEIGRYIYRNYIQILIDLDQICMRIYCFSSVDTYIWAYMQISNNLHIILNSGGRVFRQ